MNDQSLTRQDINPELKRPVSGRPNSGRPSSGRPISAQPVLHKPCSATLSKFHDSVNYSFIVGGTKLNTSSKNTSFVDSEYEMRKQIRDKYKYMTRTKTYVDESLFGTPNAQLIRETPREFYTPPTSKHLSHSQMSNIAPLIHSSPFNTPLSATRSEQQVNQNVNDLVVTNRPQTPSKRPWRP